MKLEVGIDLGTTNSVVAYFNSGKIEFLKFRNSDVLPSVLLYKDGKVTIGEMAKRKAVVNSENFIKSSKTFMGDIQKKWHIEDREFSPTDVATEILKEIKKSLEKKFGDVDEIEAVITVPAYFTSNQIDETKKAGENAGLNVKQIITEPVAAAVAYGFEDEVNQTLFIVDIGGGTFDTAILKVSNDSFSTIAIDGDRKLGGDNFDEDILNFFLKKIRKEKGVNLSSFDKAGIPKDEYFRAKQALVNEAEDTKKALSEYEEVEVEIANLLPGYNFQTKLTRDEFEDLSEESIEKIKRVIKKTLKQANLEANDVDKVVLVGGSSKIPVVREFVTKLFNKAPYSDKPLDKLVAMGAVLVAKSGNTLQIKDIISHSLGIEIIGERFSPILRKNQHYPIQHSEIYTTTIDNQQQIDINVYEGEDEDINNNEFFGGFSLTNIENARAGVPQIEVTFEFDKNRILLVTARDLKTNSTKSETIDIDKGVKKQIEPEQKPFDIAIIMDVSTSMSGTPLKKAKKACERLVGDMIDLTIHKVGLVEFGSYGKKRASLSDDLDYLLSSISEMSCYGSTDMAGGLQVARKKVLDEAVNSKVAILVTDGYPDYNNDALIQGEKLKNDTKLITIGIGNGVDKKFLKELASSKDDYYSGSDFSELTSIFEKISSSLQKF